MENEVKKMLVLGGGRHQTGLISYAIDNGIEVILSDYLQESPGHKIATKSYLTSTLDFSANIDHARNHSVNGVLTTGTDQPLLIMADICEELGLKSYLTPESSRNCTNKRRMFLCLSDINIPKYRIFDANQSVEINFEEFEFPIIVKPFDSQGQRGISIIQAESEFNNAVKRAKSKSNDVSVIVQEYLQGPEMTISAWVHNGDIRILLITDRLTYNKDKAVGVCLQHVYPSKHIVGLELEAEEMTQKIAKAYNLENGPIYIQFLKARGKLFLVEATCRIGGGHEDRLIETVTGVNIYPHLINLGLSGTSEEFEFSNRFPVQGVYSMVCFIVAKEGTLYKQFIEEDNVKGYGYKEGGFYYDDGHVQKEIANSMGRIGYFICTGSSREELDKNAMAIYSKFKAKDKYGVDLVFWPNDNFLNQ